MEKNTSLSRNYHNLTSHYNVYFNGLDSYKKGVTKAHKSVKNDFNKVLPVFLYEDDDLHSVVNSDMKRAIDKATKVITFHSITAKPKVKEGDQSPKDKAFFEQNEFNKWVDDSYMLMGKAYMYQGKYFLAGETFKHVLITFPNEDIHYMAMAWLARAYIMIGEMREAERLLVSLTDEADFPEEYLPDLLTTRAQYRIAREEYDASAGLIEQVLKGKRVKKRDRIRYTYILAQLYERAGKNNLALERYRQVTRYNPPYEMEFNARVSMAEVYESGSAGSSELKKLLMKMLRDSKNTEYKDQIYFALGNIAMEEGEKEKAIEYYTLSVSESVQNNYQKGFSSLTLAKIFYAQPDYILSAAYYDSAVSFLDKEFPGYNNLATLSASLGGLVRNISSYELEDSVQMLAALPEEERFAVIDGIIEQVKQDEEEARLAGQQAMQNMAFNQSMLNNSNAPGGPGNQQGGQWYFYNLNAKSFGQPEFRMKWGDRKLEDNWRRKNKQSLSDLTGGAGAEGDSTGTGEGTPLFDNKSREFYLVDIPLTDSAMEQSNIRMEDALYNMGVIYQENLLDYKESIWAFEKLLERFPDGRYPASAMYHLYNLNNIVQNSERASYYKSRLLEAYPESHYSKLLSNPNYIAELEAEEQKVTRAYESLFEAYREERYQDVITGADSSLSRYPGDPLVPKFMYIRALSQGALLGKEEMKTGLDSLIALYPNTEEGKQAREMVDYMYVEFPEIKEAEHAREAEVLYTSFDPGQEHYFLLALSQDQNINQVSFDLLNYNLDHFNEYDLDLERVELEDGFNMVMVKPFNNAEAATRYLEVIGENAGSILSGIPAEDYRMMIISTDNFAILSENKIHRPYYLFYVNHYLNGLNGEQ